MKELRVFVVDDELPARQRLEDLLGDQPGVTIAGIFDDGRAAARAIADAPPDLVFLDIQMPEVDGFDVIRRVGAEHMPAVIFVTAYDRYAVQAFETYALDYLLKPFDDERFERALEHARRQIRLRHVAALSEQLAGLLREAEGGGTPTAATPGTSAAAETYLRFIAVKVRDETLLVPVDEVDYVTSEGPYAEVHAGRKVHLIRERMNTLEEQLDPSAFCRIHRSHIVNLHRIEALLSAFRGDAVVRLHDGTRLRVSRSRRADLERRLGMT